MRKFILAVLAFGMMAAAQSQQIYYSYQAAQGTWSQYNKKWSWGKNYDLELRFTIQSNTILVNDKAESTYRLTKQSFVDEDYKSVQKGWDAIDEKGIRCFVKIAKQKTNGSVQLYVMYSDYAFVYYLQI